MTIKKLLLLLPFAGFWGNAQILDEYPAKQDFYTGGIVQFYKEAHDLLIKNNIQECDSKEIYQPRILITKDAEVKVVKDHDEEHIAKNKCSYEVSKLLLNNLKGWKAAQLNNENVGALTDLLICPFDIMSNYKDGYNAYEFVTEAKYPNGYEEFSKDFKRIFESLFENSDLRGKLVLEFYVDKTGKISNYRFSPNVDSYDFNKDFDKGILRIKKVWIPATYKLIPIKQKVIHNVNFSTKYFDKDIFR